MRPQYKIGQIVSVRKNDGFIFAGRIDKFGSCTMEDGRVDEYVWIKRGMWSYDEISPATPDQITEVNASEKRLAEMLMAGEKLMNILAKCEAMAEAEDGGLIND
jgi:hypothetical protein